MAKRRGSLTARSREFRAIVRAVKMDKPRFIRRLQGLVRMDGACIRFLGAHTKDGYGRMMLRLPVRNGHMLRLQIYAQRLFLILRLGRAIKLDHDAGHEPECPHRDCVLHVFEQHYALNCDTNGKGGTAEVCPF